MRRVLADGTNIIIFVLDGLVRTRFWMVYKSGSWVEVCLDFSNSPSFPQEGLESCGNESYGLSGVRGRDYNTIKLKFGRIWRYDLWKEICKVAL
jgi:hypothetical protein